MPNRIFIMGYGSENLSAEEQAKLDDHVGKWKSHAWSQDVYSPFDKRDSRFEVVQQTFDSEEDRVDGKRVIVYDDITIENNADEATILEAVKELKSALPALAFEVHTEDKQLV